MALEIWHEIEMAVSQGTSSVYNSLQLTLSPLPNLDRSIIHNLNIHLKAILLWRRRQTNITHFSWCWDSVDLESMKQRWFEGMGPSLKRGELSGYVGKAKRHSKLRGKRQGSSCGVLGRSGVSWLWLFLAVSSWMKTIVSMIPSGRLKIPNLELCWYHWSNNIGENLFVNYRARYIHTYIILLGREKERHNVIQRESLTCFVFLTMSPSFMF